MKLCSEGGEFAKWKFIIFHPRGEWNKVPRFENLFVVRLVQKAELCIVVKSPLMEYGWRSILILWLNIFEISHFVARRSKNVKCAGWKVVESAILVVTRQYLNVSRVITVQEMTKPRPKANVIPSNYNSMLVSCSERFPPKISHWYPIVRLERIDHTFKITLQ